VNPFAYIVTDVISREEFWKMRPARRHAERKLGFESLQRPFGRIGVIDSLARPIKDYRRL
jgi:hypothetical protein